MAVSSVIVLTSASSETITVIVLKEMCDLIGLFKVQRLLGPSLSRNISLQPQLRFHQSCCEP